MSEIDKFFQDLQEDSPKFEETKEETPVVETPVEKEDEIPEKEPRKNRRHRRWEAQLTEKEQELAIKEARLQALAEAKVTSGDVDPRLLTLYGDNENGRLAAKLTQELLADTAKRAREEALRDFKDEQQKSIAEQQRYESMIDDKLEDLEDEFNVDLTSNAPAAKKARREFLELVQKLSPKDEEGNIQSYADFDSAFELYQANKKAAATVPSRSKDLADRTMQDSVPASPQAQSKTEYDRTKAYLKSIGLNIK